MINFEIQEKMKQNGVPGLGIAVLQHGQMAWQGSYGVVEAGTQLTVTEESLFPACSISKMVTAIGVLCLVQEGVLSLEEDVNRYLVSWNVPENQFTKQKKVTLRNLLAHQAGFVDLRGSFDTYQEQDPFPSPKELLMGTTKYHSELAQVTYLPESRFSYSDAGYTVVEQILEDVSGESFAAALERLVMKPLGLKRTLFWDGITNEPAGAIMGHDKWGHVVEGKRAHYPNLSGAGLWTTPKELSVLSSEVMKAWNGDPNGILRPAMAKMMLTGYASDKGVGLGVFLPHAGEQLGFVSQGWGVGSQSKLVGYPRQESCIAVMMNAEPGKPQNESLIGEVIREMCKHYELPML
ncbi:serine hydrolase domain-containing protein [Bacillus sp. FJAT-28004]|uniref:serine hydrolase domain-containing protein n=1 Tax=Bacillus sp. FJAT-28004 TaxID=1679165 RepID=UPI0006B42CA8|nr:serine hydrolase domain-containing protein [Bacillus sp. FJAT-28004]